MWNVSVGGKTRDGLDRTLFTQKIVSIYLGDAATNCGITSVPRRSSTTVKS